MKSTRVLMILMVLLAAGAALCAQDRSARTERVLADAEQAQVLYGGVIAPAKAKADTIYLLGGPERGDGNFQDEIWPSFPRDEGFETIDMTEKTEAIWHISTYNAALLDPGTPSNHAMWCGEDFPICAPGDPLGGYGNNYNEYLDWYGIVPNALGNTAVRLTARLNYENEVGFDYLFLEVERQGGLEVVGTWNGTNRDGGTGEFVPVDVDLSFTVTPQDYVDGDQVHLRWRFISDGAWSDEDCLNPTAGGAQVDEITVYFNGIPWAIDDFEPGNWVNWNVAFPPSVGDFAWTWPALQDIDPCRTNWTPQFAFIDDGLVVSGTGGYSCTTWCYGPDGYIVNPEGGLAGPDYYVHNEIWSPSIEWPGSGYDGCLFAFEAYRHEALAASSPGVFYVWHVRSTADPTGVNGWSAWQDRGFVYYGGPDYIRQHELVTDLLVSDRRYVQVALGVQEVGYIWGFTGTDGSPAPYFDNLMLTAFQFGGPAISTRDIDQAQDNFPEIGVIDLLNPGANSIRFDMVQNIAPQDDLWNDPGDSITFDVVAVRAASVLNDLPKLYYKLDPNPIFDPYRTSGLPSSGWVYGDSTRAAGGFVIADRFNFDLPDTGFFFPGDVLHYYVEAEDNAGGDVKTSILPADTTGFSAFPGDASYSPLTYSRTFTIYGLPTVHDLAGSQPPILLWNDFGSRGGEDEWQYALMNLGYLPTIDYDLYTTRGPSSGVGNGLGGRATDLQLMGYETLLYASGDLSVFTVSNGDPVNDAGDDVGLLDAWLRQGGKNMLLTGDDLVFDLQQSGTATQAFISNWISVEFVAQELRPLIGNQASPLVRAVPGNPVFTGVTEWIANGGCPILNTFDAVEPLGTAERLAEFTAPNGSSGAYPYSAATLYQEPTYGNTTIHLPYDFMYILEPRGPGSKAPLGSALRTAVLEEILLAFGHISGSPVTDVPEMGVLSLRNYPNPFNPSTKIVYNLPRRGDLSIKVYSLRGELVATLVDGVHEAGPGQVTWAGVDDRGGSVASGIYFCELQALGKSRIQKMTLLK
jgi:hypothetical protein